MRFRRRVAANGTKVPPLPSPRAAPALTPIFALAPILARAPIPKPARRCCHRPSSASPLASDAERPPASTLATSPPLRPSALAFPSRLPISPPISHQSPPSRPPISHQSPPSRLSRPRFPVMCACPSCPPSCLCSGAPAPSWPLRQRQRPPIAASSGRHPRAARALGDLGRSWRSCSPARSASRPLKCLLSGLLCDVTRLVTDVVPRPSL